MAVLGMYIFDIEGSLFLFFSIFSPSMCGWRLEKVGMGAKGMGTADEV